MRWLLAAILAFTTLACGGDTGTTPGKDEGEYLTGTYRGQLISFVAELEFQGRDVTLRRQVAHRPDETETYDHGTAYASEDSVHFSWNKGDTLTTSAERFADSLRITVYWDGFPKYLTLERES